MEIYVSCFYFVYNLFVLRYGVVKGEILLRKLILDDEINFSLL